MVLRCCHYRKYVPALLTGLSMPQLRFSSKPPQSLKQRLKGVLKRANTEFYQKQTLDFILLQR